jgi:hypothetical protein
MGFGSLGGEAAAGRLDHGPAGAEKFAGKFRIKKDRWLPVLFYFLRRLLCRRFGRIAHALHLVVRLLHAGCLPANDLRDIFRQISRYRFLVAFFGVILASLDRFENRLIAGAEADFPQTKTKFPATASRSC